MREIFGWNRVPSGSTYGRFFKKFSQAENNRFFSELGRWSLEQIKFENYTLDVDSSVITHYGEPGRQPQRIQPAQAWTRLDHPLLAFISELRMVANC